MAIVTPVGLVIQGESGFKTEIGTAFRNSLGQDLSLADETLQGQLITALSTVFTKLEENVIEVNNGLSIGSMSGTQLGDVGVLFQLPRKTATRTTVSVTITGSANTVIPKGARAKTEMDVVYRSQAAITIGSNGTATGTFEAVVTGATVLASGSLTQIVDAQAGWTSITNAAAGTTGRNRETDGEYRTRLRDSIMHNVCGSVHGIRGRLLEVDDVTHAEVRDNKTSSSVTANGITIAAYSMMAIVRGGTTANVAKAIFDSIVPGVPMVGDTTSTVEDEDGNNVTIKFQRVTDIRLKSTVTITTNNNFPADGQAQMRKAIVSWWEDNVELGTTPAVNALYGPAYSIAGHTVSSITLLRNNNAAVGTADADEFMSLESADITITIS